MRLPITSLLRSQSVGPSPRTPRRPLPRRPPPLDVEAVKKSCDKGNAADCLTLAAAYQSGEGAPRDAGKASGFYKKACDGQQAKGCFELAAMHVAGQGGSKDVTKAITLFQRSCDLKYAESCIRLAILYSDGKDVPRTSAARARCSRSPARAEWRAPA